MRIDRDFRYTLPDGTEVEAFQVTEASRYQEDLQPDWMNSRMWLTAEGEGGKKTDYLKIGDSETEIPSYGWLMRMPSGTIQVVDYTVMEGAVKVVKEVPVIPDPIKPQPDDALKLAAKLEGRPFEEVKQEDMEQVALSNARRQEIIDSLEPEVALKMDLEQTAKYDDFPNARPIFANIPSPPVADSPETPAVVSQQTDRGLLFEARAAYQLMTDEKHAEAAGKLHEALLERCNWCDCPPGKCEGADDIWDCRRNSPLAS